MDSRHFFILPAEEEPNHRWPEMDEGPSDWVITSKEGTSGCAYPESVAQHIADAMDTAWAAGHNEAAEDSAKAFGAVLYLLERNQWATATRIIREKLSIHTPQYLPPLPGPTPKRGEG